MQSACAGIVDLSVSTVFFPHYLLRGMVFGKKIIEHKICILFSVQLSFETFLILGSIERDIIINVHISVCM